MIEDCTYAMPWQGREERITSPGQFGGEMPNVKGQNHGSDESKSWAFCAVESTVESRKSRSRERENGLIAKTRPDKILKESVDWGDNVAGRVLPLFTSATQEGAWRIPELVALGTCSFVLCAPASTREFLAAALEELADLDAYAAEVALPPPAPMARKAARKLLEKLVRMAPREYDLSPWENGGVVVYSCGGPGRRVSILCDERGEASYLVIHPDPKREVFPTPAQAVQELPMDILAQAVRELDEGPE